MGLMANLSWSTCHTAWIFTESTRHTVNSSRSTSHSCLCVTSRLVAYLVWYPLQLPEDQRTLLYYTSDHLLQINNDIVISDKPVVRDLDVLFLQSNCLTCCDQLFPSSVRYIYINDHLMQQSYIDYIIMSSPGSVLSFNILDPDINFSDHFPLLVSVRYDISTDWPPGSAHISGNTNGLKHRYNLYRLCRRSIILWVLKRVRISAKYLWWRDCVLYKQTVQRHRLSAHGRQHL